MYEYQIEEICKLSENKYSVEISLDEDGLYSLTIVFDFPNDFFDDCITGYATSSLKKMLADDDDLYLIRITRIALGNEKVKNDLRKGKKAIFKINYKKWVKIFDQIQQEQLELKKTKLEFILAQGIEDI